MRKIILNVATSLNGFIEGANGEYDWCFTDYDYGMEAFLQSTDAIFFGGRAMNYLLHLFSICGATSNIMSSPIYQMKCPQVSNSLVEM